jgi:serine/threonine-protein kinase
VQQPRVQPPPAPAGRAEGSGSRQVLIVLAVVLALLVLLCAGVISFLYKQGSNSAVGVVGGGAPAASYGLRNDLIPASEGRQTL